MVVVVVAAGVVVPRAGLTSAGFDAPNRPVPLDKPLKLGKVAELAGLATALAKFVFDADVPRLVNVLVFEVADDKLPPKLMLLPKPVAGVVVAGLVPPKLKPPKPVDAGAAVVAAVTAGAVVVVELAPPKLNPPKPVEAGAVADVVVPPSLKPPKPVLAAGAAVVVAAAGAVVEAPKLDVVADEPKPKLVLAGWVVADAPNSEELEVVVDGVAAAGAVAV